MLSGLGLHGHGRGSAAPGDSGHRQRDLAGSPADARLAEELGRRAQKQCRPLTNISVDPEWRREVLPVLIRRTVLRALA